MDKIVNLNADLGESFGAWSMGCDEAMLRLVDSANVACGFHAGDPLVMCRTVRLARDKGVSVGAHPAFPDLQGFGRRRMDIPPPELEAMLLYQIGALDACARAEGVRLSHVKPHGALSNVACAERPVADAVVRAVARLIEAGDTLCVLAPAASMLVAAARVAGVPVVEEIYADRTYLDDGNLVPRGQPGALIHDAEASLAHILGMLDEGCLISLDGQRIPVRAQSICVHGDNPDAVATAQVLRDGLRAAGYSFAPVSELA